MNHAEKRFELFEFQGWLKLLSFRTKCIRCWIESFGRVQPTNPERNPKRCWNQFHSSKKRFERSKQFSLIIAIMIREN